MSYNMRGCCKSVGVTFLIGLISAASAFGYPTDSVRLHLRIHGPDLSWLLYTKFVDRSGNTVVANYYSGFDPVAFDFGMVAKDSTIIENNWPIEGDWPLAQTQQFGFQLRIDTTTRLARLSIASLNIDAVFKWKFLSFVQIFDSLPISRFGDVLEIQGNAYKGMSVAFDSISRPHSMGIIEVGSSRDTSIVIDSVQMTAVAFTRASNVTVTKGEISQLVYRGKTLQFDSVLDHVEALRIYSAIGQLITHRILEAGVSSVVLASPPLPSGSYIATLGLKHYRFVAEN